MKRKSVAGIFFSMFLRAAVVILAIVIIALGVAIVKQISDSKGKGEENASVDESILAGEDDDHLLTAESTEADVSSEASDAGTAAESSADKKIEVLNGTDTAGLAGHWRDTLTSAGYVDVNAHNYYGRVENTRILVASEGMGQDLQQYFPNAEYQVGTLTSDDTDASVDGVEIFIIIGTNDDVLSGQ